MALPSFDIWAKRAVGKPDNIDKIYGNQCVDVPKSYAEYLFPGVKWTISVGIGNGKDVYANANAKYFQKIINNAKDLNQLPKKGDIIVYSSVKGNPYGHVAIVESATTKGCNLIQQDGFIDKNKDGNADGVTHRKFKAWGVTPCIGWLRPIAPIVKPAPKPVVKPAPKPAPAPVIPPTPKPVPVPVVVPAKTLYDFCKELFDKLITFLRSYKKG